MAEPPILVVGAGLAGLACAVRLHRHGQPVLVLEGSDAVGGRVRTDEVNGFRIDRGFQVLNTGYPALREPVAALDLRLLPRGVRVRRDGRLHDVPHPLASPTAPIRALTSAVTGPLSKLALARYAGALVASSPDAIKRRPDVSAIDAWAEHLPADVIADVLVPFLSGVVLDREVRTSRVFTDLMMRLFALGQSAVPATGMQALPEWFAARLPDDAVRLDTPVRAVGAEGVELADGTALEARAVVVAVDPWTAHTLVPGLGTPPEARGVTTYYFAAQPWSGIDGRLAVDADGSGVANSVVLTASAPEYSSDGRALIATSVVHDEHEAVPGEQRSAEVRAVAADLHGTSAELELIALRSIPRALPAMPAPHPLTRPAFDPASGVWIAGDHRDTSSLQGAVVSGRRIAGGVLAALSGISGAEHSSGGRHRRAG